MSMTASHHELAFDTLDRLSAGADTIVHEVIRCSVITGAVLLATCNRFELYLDVDAPLCGEGVQHAAREAARLVAAGSGIDEEAALASFRVRTGADVAQHLFAVATGLDSMVVGEREIAGQVRRALAASREAHACSPTLELLFRHAAHTSKQVARHTVLGSAGRSVVALGLDLAAAHLSPWGQTRALLVGTGAYAGAVLAALGSRGCAQVCVYSPSGRAGAFAAKRGIGVADDLAGALAGSDLVVSCSGARTRGPGSPDDTGYVLGTDTIRAATGPLVVVDLALHRDVDPRIAGLEGVELFDLAALAARAPETEIASVATAWRIVDDAVAAFEEDRLGRQADQEVIALVNQADERIAAETAEASKCVAAEKQDALATSIRRRVRAETHQQILQTRARVIAEARAAEQSAGGKPS